MTFGRRSAGTGRSAGLLAALVAVAGLLSGCVFGGPSGPEPASHRPTELGGGTIGGMPWILTVSSDHEGDLCMAVNDQLVGTTRPGEDFVEDGCGFGPPDERLSSLFDETEAGGIRLMWGPAPQGAVRVRLSSLSMPPESPSDPRAAYIPGCPASDPGQLWVDITEPLPAWTKPGGWFLTHASSAGCGYSDVVFYDAQGRVVPDHRW